MRTPRATCVLSCLLALTAWTNSEAAYAAQTVYTLPQDVRWTPLSGKGVHPGAFHAYLRGKASDRCGQIERVKFPDGFIYPWHTNGVSGIFTVLKGTLVIGFDKNHLLSAEKALPAGSVMEGLATEPHYGRAVGETIFDIYLPC